MKPVSLRKLSFIASAIGALLALPSQVLSADWIGTSGYWDDAGNWHSGIPSGIDDVTINVPDAQTIYVVSGNNFANSINVTGDETLSIYSGTLTVGATSNFFNFAQSGGTLGGAGDININGSASWTGGMMSGTGNTIINSDLTISGSGYKYLNDGRTLTNNGTTNWSSELIANTSCHYYGCNTYYTDTVFYVGNNSEIINNGTWLDQGNNTNRINNYGGALGSLTTGFIQKLELGIRILILVSITPAQARSMLKQVIFI